MTSFNDKNQIVNLYTRTARIYDWLFIQLLGWGRAMRRFFTRQNYLFSNCKVLDAGCGTGAATKALYQVAKKKGLSNVTFHVFDFTPAMLNLFKRWLDKKQIDSVQLRQADILELHTLPDHWKEYDLIVFSGLLEYIPKNKLSHALINLKNLLKPDGVIVGFVSRRNAINKLSQYIWKQAIFEENEVRRAFENVGLKIVFKELPFPDNHMHRWCYVVEARKQDS